MKMLIGILSLSVAITGYADTLRLTNGKELTGTVTSYANMTFEVSVEGGGKIRQPAGMVKSIEFAPRSVKLDARGRAPVEGKLTAFENSAFVITTTDGKTETVSAIMVAGVTFGGCGKKINLIKNPDGDSRKYLVKDQITLVYYYTPGLAICKTVANDLEKIAKEDSDVYLQKIELTSLTTIYAKKNNIIKVPRTEVYDRKGKAVDAVVGAGIDAVRTYINIAKEAK